MKKKDYMKALKNEYLIKKLQAEKQRLKRVPMSEDINISSKAGRTPSVQAYKNHFGTFNRALKIAGFKATRINKYSKEKLLSDLKKVYTLLGRIATIKELRQFHVDKIMAERSVYLKYFGTLKAAYEALEVDFDSEKNKSLERRRKKFIDQLQSLSSEERKNLTKEKWLSFYKKKKFYHFDTFVTEFGSWFKALQTAGIYTKRKRYSSAELIEILKAEYSFTNQAPTSSYFDHMSKQGLLPSAGSYFYHFGSWKNALITAEIPTP